MPYLSFIVVSLATVIALITDLKYRIIYKNITIPVYVVGLCYSLYRIVPQNTKIGIISIWYILQVWLGPVLFIFIYSLLLFWLGILDGGDGQFLIAITPWLGAQRIIEVILYFYPLAILYLTGYLLFQNKFNFKQVALEQYRDLITMVKAIPNIFTNIKGGKEHVLVKNVAYESRTEIPPAGMVPISIAILISLVT